MFEEEKTAKKGFFLSLKVLIIIGIVISLVFAASIIATYFGKSCTDCNKIIPIKCQDLYCTNSNITAGKSQ